VSPIFDAERAKDLAALGAHGKTDALTPLAAGARTTCEVADHHEAGVRLMAGDQAVKLVYWTRYARVIRGEARLAARIVRRNSVPSDR
jgi:hypothetical protein